MSVMAEDIFKYACPNSAELFSQVIFQKAHILNLHQETRHS